MRRAKRDIMVIMTMNDTHPDAERVQIELLRQAGPERRVAMACALTDQVMAMSKAAISRAHPGLSKIEQDLLFIDVHYGRAVADWVQAIMERDRHVD